MAETTTITKMQIKQAIQNLEREAGYKIKQPLNYSFGTKDECKELLKSIFIEVEPLGGKRQVKISERRTRIDWAQFIKEMLKERYPDAQKVVLVMDNLNTHNTASLYTAFPPEEARGLAERLEIHYTPKHGSWLNIAEIELSVLKRQCLAGRIPCIQQLRSEVNAWNVDRNNRQATVDWQFRTDGARIKLKRLYPKL